MSGSTTIGHTPGSLGSRSLGEPTIRDALDLQLPRSLGDPTPTGLGNGIATLPRSNGRVRQIKRPGKRRQIGKAPKDRGEGAGVGFVGHGPDDVQNARDLSTDRVPVTQETPGSRLRRLRIAKGFANAADAARAIGVAVVTFQHHENGRRAVSRQAAERYGRYFGVAAGTILYGEDLQTAHRVPIVGTIRGGGVIAMDGSRAESASAPPGAAHDLHALVVDTDDLFPAYRRGDVVFYRRPGPLPPDLDALNGRDCVVTLEDGRVLIRMVAAGANGLASLIAFGGPPILNVRPVVAAPVAWVQRGPVAG